MNKDNAINDATIKIDEIDWYAPQYTPSVPQQAILTKQILSKTPTELHHVEGSVFMKEVKTQFFLTFELGTKKGIKIPIWINVGFQQRDRQDSQSFKDDTL